MKQGSDYIGVSAGAIVINAENKVLISKRSAKTRNQHSTWEFPGGGVDLFETREESIIREIKEEFDIDIKIVDTLGVYDYIIEDDGQHWLTTTFIAKHIGGQAKNMEPDKSQEFKWVNLSELKDYKLSRISELNLRTIEDKGLKMKWINE